MHRNEGWVGGVVLIIIGVALLVGQVVGDVGRFILLGIGIALLVLYAITRTPGTLIGGGIVTGLGAGVLASTYLQDEQSGAAVLFGLGGGFILVWIVGLFANHEETRVWPLIPGVILIVIGAGIAAQADPQLVALVWPVALIALGVIVILAAVLRRPSARPAVPPPSTPAADASADPAQRS